MNVPPELERSLLVDHHDHDQLLVVIGNGFDLFHGYKSRYQDFWQQVGTTPLDEIVHFNRQARGQQVRWSDVEAQIRVAAENAYQLSATRRMPGAGVMVQQRSTRAIRRFEHDFSRYLRTERERVLISDPTRSQTAREMLSEAGAILNFNYTDTATQLYDVWPENVYYLHGSLLEGQTILGVDNDDVIAREPYEYASTTKGYRRDILDFKRWYWIKNNFGPIPEKTLAAFRAYDAYYYGWRRLYPAFGDHEIISLLYTLDSDMPVTSRYFATRFFEQWQTRRQWLIDAIARRCCISAI
ncbi:MAG: AbiH family protein [Limosilactobacillus mucosae]